MIPDFHLHTDFSADCDAPARTQIDRCLALGMEELCITDHHDYGAGENGERFFLDFDRYFPALRRIRDEYEGRIRVNIGIELGLQLSVRDYLEATVPTLDVDYLIGSCHFVDGLDPYYPTYYQGKTEQEAYARYFEVVLRRVKALDCYDSLGHLDYIVRYGPTRGQNYRWQDHQDYIDPILKTLIQKGKALECNTAGYKYGLGHPNPHEGILRRYRELGGELLTIGSDAHRPEHIACEFFRLPALLKDCGFRYYTVYHDRRPEFHPL